MAAVYPVTNQHPGWARSGWRYSKVGFTKGMGSETMNVFENKRCQDSVLCINVTFVEGGLKDPKIENWTRNRLVTIFKPLMYSSQSLSYSSFFFCRILIHSPQLSYLLCDDFDQAFFFLNFLFHIVNRLYIYRKISYLVLDKILLQRWFLAIGFQVITLSYCS